MSYKLEKFEDILRYVKRHQNHIVKVAVDSERRNTVQTQYTLIGDLVSKETVSCVDGKVKHYVKLSSSGQREKIQRPAFRALAVCQSQYRILW